MICVVVGCLKSWRD